MDQNFCQGSPVYEWFVSLSLSLSLSLCVCTAADVVAVLGHPAVHAPSHAHLAEQGEHVATGDDSRAVSGGSSHGRHSPPTVADTVVSSTFSAPNFRKIINVVCPSKWNRMRMENGNLGSCSLALYFWA